MDPQQRIFLETAWSALEAAGYDPERYAGLIGVFGGVARNTYFIRNAEVYRDLMDMGGLYQAILSSDKDYVATAPPSGRTTNSPLPRALLSSASAGKKTTAARNPANLRSVSSMSVRSATSPSGTDSSESTSIRAKTTGIPCSFPVIMEFQPRPVSPRLPAQPYR